MERLTKPLTQLSNQELVDHYNAQLAKLKRKQEEEEQVAEDQIIFLRIEIMEVKQHIRRIEGEAYSRGIGIEGK